ncbi:MAG TPA: hypothetical protein DHU90_16090 [Sphingobacterium sp.]|nr:hypothetical protein [Sphingobacterium sp.]HAU54651.1 hypothetical protein [Sphingobacterium sp.]HCX58069.1 hypothetical protein [Sphingobacterium sp.]
MLLGILIVYRLSKKHRFKRTIGTRSINSTIDAQDIGKSLFKHIISLFISTPCRHEATTTRLTASSKNKGTAFVNY